MRGVVDECEWAAAMGKPDGLADGPTCPRSLHRHRTPGAAVMSQARTKSCDAGQCRRPRHGDWRHTLHAVAQSWPAQEAQQSVLRCSGVNGCRVGGYTNLSASLCEPSIWICGRAAPRYETVAVLPEGSSLGARPVSAWRCSCAHRLWVITSQVALWLSQVTLRA